MLRTFSPGFSFLCLFFICISTPAFLHAQEPVVFEGKLEEGDKIVDDRFIDYHEIELEAGELVVISMAGTDDELRLDTIVNVSGPGGQELRNDDVPDFPGSRITMVVPESGTWDIGATAFGEEGGNYKVTVERSLVEKISGERGDLEEGDDRLPKRGEYYDEYELQMEAGETYIISCSSSDFDSFLAVRFPGGHVFNDDVDSGARKSMVVVRPQDTGVAIIYMTSNSPESTGRYRLNMFKVVQQ